MKTKFTLSSKFNLQTVFTVIFIAATCTFLLGQIVKKAPRIISNANTSNVSRLAAPSCDGLWTITTVRTYDPVSNTTTYTFSVTKTGARNALSHWGFPITLCPDQPGTVQQILAGHTAQSSLDQVTWSATSTSYGKDPSTNPQCTNEDVLKFNEAMGNETTRYYRLILNGNWSLIPETAYVKYGNNCCTLNMNTPGCLEEGCLPPPCTISGNNNVCPSSTNTYSASAGNDTYSWTVISGTATIIGSSTSPTVQVQAGPTCGFFTLRLTTTKGDCQSICSETYTIADANSPSFTGSYVDVILACVADAPGSLGTATATDACGTVTITSSDGSIVSNGCNRSITRTFTARDGCNNTATTSRTVRWISILSGPGLFVGGQSITGTTTFDLGCNPLDATINTTLGEATATNTCGSVSVTALDGPITSDGCNRARVRTFSATDGCGNIATAARIVRWIISNIGGPQINPSSAPTVLGCNPSENDINAALGTVTATDACANVTITSSDGPTQSDGCGRSRTRTFTATGGCGNTATASRTVTWTSDNTAPSFTGSYTDVNLGCNPANPGGSLGTATATDACGAVTITSSDGTVVSDGCTRSQTRTFTARDACNNTATVSRTVRWAADNIPPSFTGSYTDVNLGCNPTDPSGSLGTATATDACGTVTITSSDGTVVSDACSRSQTRTFTARDACNNTATISRTVRWAADNNNTPPSFTGSYTDLNLGCNPADPSGSLGTATATDACGAVTITSSDGAVVSDGCNRSQTRTFTARDACNNTATVSRIVRWTADNTPPSFTSTYTDVNLGCNPANPNGSLGTATATDACGAVTITSSDGSVVSDGCNRSQTRTFTARDACNNTATVSRTARWTADNIPPSFTGSYIDVNLGCSPADPSGSLGTATATDGCGPVTITSSDGSVVSDGCNRSQTRTFTARDACNNTATVSRTVRWAADNTNTPPSFTGSYTDVNLGCNPANPSGSLGTATATDACGAVTITSSDGSVVSDGCNRSQTRTFTARDACNNTAIISRIVRWTSDNTPPSFTGTYTDVNLGCNPTNPGGSLGTATASDACGAVTITSSDGTVVSDGCNRSQTRTFTARDACNNTATVSRTARWTADNIPPSFTGSYTDVNLGCSPADPSGSLGTAAATDGCGPVTITSSDGTVVSDGCNRSQTRTFTARDACNNTTTVSRTVRWTADNTSPSFTGTYTDVNLGCSPANPSGSLGTATATDVCGAVTITSSDGAVVSDGCNRSQTRTFTVRDACNNTATVSRTVRWISDNIPPVITTGGTTTILGCNPSANDINGALGTATASDVCGNSTETGGGPLPGSCIREYKGNNGGGNCPDLAGLPPTGKVTLFFTSAVTVAPTIMSVTDNDPVSDLSNVRFGPGDLSNNGLSAEYCYYDGPNNNNNLWGGGVILTFNLQFATGQGCTEQAPGSPSGSGTVVIPTSNDGPVVSNGCSRSQTRTWTAIDACGNTATASRTVTWTSDNTPPSFTGSYTDVNLGCNPASPSGSLGTATAIDACGAVTITSSDGAVISDGCSRSQTRTFTARDACNNTATTSRTVRWTADNIPPSFTGSYTDVNLGCNPANPSGSLGTATANDACGAVTITSSDGAVVSDGCNRSQTRIFTARDACNNTATVSRTVRWISDNIPPVITTGGTTTILGCNPSANDINGALGTATASDVCGNSTETGGGPLPGSCIREYKGNNGGGNCPDLAGLPPTGKVTLFFTSAVTVAPTIMSVSDNDPVSDLSNVRFGPGDLSNNGLSAEYCYYDGPNNNNNLWGGGVILTFNLQFATGQGCAEQAPGSPSPGGSGTVVIPTSNDGPVVSNGCSRSQTRTWTAIDACGNTATASRTVTWTADNTPPSFTGSYTDVNLGCNPTSPNGSLGTATATDACGAVTITSSDGTVVSDGCSRSQTRTFTVRDACNNTATTSRTVRWTADNTPPSFTGSYTDVNLGCNPADPNGSLGTATATDGCGPVTITSSDGAVQSDGCSRWRTRTFTATDGCLNTATTSRTVRWTADNTPPSFTGSYTDVNLGCNPTSPSGSLGTATATDACGAVTITSSDGTVVSDGCSRSQTRTFTARDACNNTATTSRTVRWTADNTPPSFTGSYTDVNLGCNPADPNGSLGTATATDGCGPVTITSSDGAVQSDGCSRWRTRTFTATDGCLNTATTSRTVRWTADNTPPSFTGSYTDVNLGCNPASPSGSLGTATATDACGAVTITSSDGTVVSDGCSRSQTRTFTARDACNNTATTSRTVRWTADNTPPSFTGSYTDVNLGCNPADPNGSLGTATATDGCGPVTITSSDGAVQSDGCSRWRTRTFTATDGCLNTATTSRTVRWTADNTPPSFTGSYTDVNLGCNPTSPSGSLGTATATDACGAVTITSSDGTVVSDGCSRSQTRTFTARDACNNTATTSRTVRWTADNTPPSFTGSYTDVNLGCNPASPSGSLGTATATDACGAVTITSSDGTVVSDGCSRSQTRTFTARDACNNTATTSRTVRWTADNTPPSFTGSYTDVNLGCNPADPNGSLGTATATDGCGPVTITSSDGAVQSDGCSRWRTRTFTATDGCLNTATTSRTVRWTADNTPPSFTGSYTDVNLGCNPADPNGSLGTATATDGCGPVTITSSDGAVQSDGCSRWRTRTFTATDGCLNTATTSRTVRWTADNTPPSFTGSYTDVNLGCNPTSPSGSLGTATATDACGAVTITSSDGTVVSDGCSRSQTRTFTARDACNNTATTSRTVRWTADNTPPSFTGSYTDVNLGCNPASPSGSLGTATATDACGAVTITSSDGTVVSDGCSRSQTRTFTARDACNNTATTSRTVRWTADNTPPSFTGSYTDVNLGCNPADPNGSLGTATATDGCGPVTITSSDGAVQSDGCARWRTRTFTATDGCLNTATTSRTVRWTADNTPPSFTGSYTDVNLGCNPASPSGSLGTATATDACGAVTITSSDGTVVSDGCSRSQTRTFTARDACNNTATTSRTVRWTADNTPPSFTGSYTDVNLGCNPADPNGSLGTATATDGCGPVTITSSDGAVQSDGCARWRTRTFTATDGCLNTATTSRTVRWTADNTPPSFTGSYTDVNLGCNPTSPSGSLGTATATDACGAVTITSSDGTVVSDGCSRSQTRTFTARDACNNTATTSRTVRWTADNTPPSFTGSYTDVNLGCNPADPNGSLGTATATDGCGPVTITSSDGAVQSDGCSRWRTRTFTATDGCLNTATTSRTVRWTADNTPPSFTGSYTDVNLGCNPTSPSGSLGTATATDACGAVTITSSDGTVVSDGCSRSQTRTFTARDACNNTATTSRTVRWTADNTPPSFTGSYTDVNLGCNPTSPSGSLGTATATDACGAVTITSSDGTVVSDGCSRSQTRTFTARDACNNTATTSRTVRWTADNTPPSFTGSYTDVNLGCNPADPNGSLGTATATDGCGPVTITSSDGAVQSDGCSRWRTRTFTATDGCLNTATTSRTVRWTADNTPPSFTGSYTDVNLGCNPTSPSGSLGTATASDACGAVTITSSDGTVVSDGCSRSQTRTFTARDACNNTATTSRTVRWTADNTPPSFTGSYTDVNLGCNPADPNGSLGTATATDGCGPVTITSSDGAVQSDGCARWRIRTFTATDGCLNTATTSRTVRWTADNTPPSFTGSYTDVILGCVADAPGSLGTATATDACGAVTITSSDGSIVSNGCNRSITRTFTARDACNNTATTSRTVRWISILSGPGLFVGGQSITGTTTFDLGCNPLDATINTTLGEATATNTCGSVSVTALDGPITSDGCNRARVRTFSATDGCGNIATAARIVRWIISNIGGPQINPSSAPTVLGCNPSENDINAALGTVTATDACANVTITSSDGPTQSDGCGRSRTRTFTATGGCGNTATASRTVTWTSDNTAPSFTGSYTDVNLGCNPANPGGSLGTATATDACGTPTVTSSDGTVQSNGCSRSQKRTWTARDACGNTATASRTVIWTSDITPPVFTTTPASVDVDCTAPVPSLVTPTASDACGTPTVTMTGSTDNPANCTTGFNRIVTRTWTARDACGNTATYTQTIRVKCCETVCTLTQGAYGNPGGNICLPNGTTVNQTQIMINALTAAPGNMVVFGRQDMNRYWVIRLSDVNQGSNSNIFEMLPGGGQSAVFGLDNVAGVPEFDNRPSWPIAPLVTIGQQAGKISNQLFSQTLTLYFNTTIAGSTLSNVSLNGLAVIAPRNCGSSTPAGTGTPTQLVSPTISSYLSTHGYAVTVGGLLQLANDALGGVNVSPLTLTQIQEAVSSINEAFDECKILTGYVAAGSGSGRVITSNSISSQPSLIVTAFPNPYKENFSLKINSPVTGQAIISFYNMSGVKVSEMKRDVVAFQDLSVPYAVPEGHRTRIVYTVNVGSYNARGIVLSPN